MSRDIKFRAFVKSEKCIHDVVAIDFKNKVVYVAIPDDISLGASVPISMNEVELVQYTEIKDVDGNEIYEGGLLKQINEDFPPIEIVWRHGMFWIKWIDAGSKLDILHILDHDEETYCKNTASKYRIIGNIYEHSHLLESEK